MKPKKRTHTDEYVKQLVQSIDLPHRRFPDGKWRAGNNYGWFVPSTQARFELYVRRLLEAGIRPGEITCMLGDLAWDSFEECMLNIPAKLEAEITELMGKTSGKLTA